MLHLVLAANLFAAPTGYDATDRFETIDEACQVLSGELAPKKWRHRALSWCRYRARQSTRGKVVSRIDGSQIHDRDRVAAWKMYAHGVSKGRIDPWACEFDKVDAGKRQPATTRKLAAKWPFRSPEMTPKKRRQWLSRSPDFEQFGTRGPIDLNTEFARRVLPGCWDPASLDRNDVAAAVTILGAVAICEKHGCRGNADIRNHWR